MYFKHAYASFLKCAIIDRACLNEVIQWSQLCMCVRVYVCVYMCMGTDNWRMLFYKYELLVNVITSIKVDLIINAPNKILKINQIHEIFMMCDF